MSALKGSCSMYNLLVGFPEGSAHAGRVFEYTPDSVKAKVAPGGVPDLTALMGLPTLVMPEIREGEPEVARLGRILNLARHGSTYTFQFVPDANVTPLPLEKMLANADRWGMQDFEFYRTHWAVKDVDAYAAMWGTVAGQSMPGPKAFQLPTDKLQSHDLVAVMMPFDAKFNSVYEALRGAAAEAGMQCQRADDIWKNEHILDDVLELIWTARVVVADLTDRNANVFYETGIAHTIGRDVVLITQNMEHVPFDLRAIRALNYYPNSEGLDHLKDGLRTRLKTILASS
ncbi:hypothetical protein H9L21_07620 [Aeromicrobium senzhongii]|uniref:Nucleoside 2-deoxyribosyltransferase n=1 Tax=Aeromicrobium senzhongii TaxID=2663859 RepID=A0ABX6SYC8_9ACTN|nr:hypothetical protein [Aeromicrobium senzhongii]MTB87167.1 hypothetical protein [Aeromicrobium senzhongii]QNL95755.1 hypothetical protein H9L21_07620 [Aeromicrobium senzhongii]